jgi:hypothetical protein
MDMREQRDAPRADAPPVASHVTDYDLEHAIIYLRLLDGVNEGADPAEIAKIVLHCDPELDRDRALRVFDAHYARAVWMTKTGYRDLLQTAAPPGVRLN